MQADLKLNKKLTTYRKAVVFVLLNGRWIDQKHAANYL